MSDAEREGEGDGDGRVRPAEVARRLGVAPSSVSRYLRNHPELLGPDGLVDFAAYAAHHDGNRRAQNELDDADRRTRLATAEIRELEAARLRGDLKPAVEVENLVLEAFHPFWGALERRLEAELRGTAELERIRAGVREEREALAERLRAVSAKG